MHSRYAQIRLRRQGLAACPTMPAAAAITRTAQPPADRGSQASLIESPVENPSTASSSNKYCGQTVLRPQAWSKKEIQKGFALSAPAVISDGAAQPLVKVSRRSHLSAGKLRPHFPLQHKPKLPRHQKAALARIEANMEADRRTSNPAAAGDARAQPNGIDGQGSRIVHKMQRSIMGFATSGGECYLICLRCCCVSLSLWWRSPWKLVCFARR